MKDSYKASAEARAQRIAEKLANQKELDELVEFLDSAIDQTPASAWKLSDIPDKEQYEECDDSEHINRINTLVEAMGKAESTTSHTAPYFLRRFLRLSQHLSNIESQFEGIRDIAGGLIYEVSPKRQVVALDHNFPVVEGLHNIARASFGTNVRLPSEESLNSSYTLTRQNFNLEPMSPVMQFHTKNTKA